MYILGIETSCDETAASIIKFNPLTEKMVVLSNIVASQIEIHQKYGGVVPEIAARERVLNILPVIHEALEKAQILPKKIDYLAVTKGPGLITSLITGVETVRALAYAWNKPVIEVNHISGHIFANFINPKTKIKYPAVIITVSGGHTNLILMDKAKKIRIIGDTRDDAAGEAYDKGAKMLGLSYPGGPIISNLAKKYYEECEGIDEAPDSDINFPRPMIDSPDLDFSFSGLKTSLFYTLKKDKKYKTRIPQYCYAYQEAIIDILIAKTIKAAKKYKAQTVMLSGGVSANQTLRNRLSETVKAQLSNVNFLAPENEYTTDNAAMIASAAAYQATAKKITNFQKIQADPSLQLK